MKKSSFKIGMLAVAFLFADQFLKWIAQTSLALPFIITPWASLRYEQNTGIAWSIAVPQPWLNILNVVLLIILPLYIARQIDLRKNHSQLFLAMLLGGALGNLADRLFRGYVIDYVSVGWWPVFNLADALLSLGIFLILVFYGKIKRV